MLNDQPMTKQSYADYTLEHLENWFHDALNEDDLSSSDIHGKIMSMLMDTREYHEKQLNKIEDLLDLMTGPRITAPIPVITEGNKKDWNDFWEGDIGTL